MALSDLTISILLAIGPFFGVLFGIYTSYTRWIESPFRKISFPPGPPSSGSILSKCKDLSQSRPWKTYFEWAKTYGDIIYFKNHGKDIIILNAIDDTTGLLEKRCSLYSDRSKNTLVDLTGWNFNTQLMNYGQEWRNHRKLYQQCFRPKAITAYRSIQTRNVQQLLKNLLQTPDEYYVHCKTASVDTVLSILYGDDLSLETNAYFVALADEATSSFSGSPVPASNFINRTPSLRYLPPWFPGAQFHKMAFGIKKVTAQLLEVPMDYIGKGLLHGTASPSLLTELLENCYMQRDFERIKSVATTTYLAGVDTTTSSMRSFFLAMAEFPDAKKKAQQEIDQVVGGTRLPTFDDRASLPYVEALFREVLRWRPPMPLNTAHVVTEADIYNGLHIPKDALIIANIWAMTRSTEKYTNPENFEPERFLDTDGKLNEDDCAFVFGFGRRICPGRHLASATVWLTIVSVLSVFDIQKKGEKENRSNGVETAYLDGAISQPLPTQCSILPRSINATKLVSRCAES